jgi:hypothetical protein
LISNPTDPDPEPILYKALLYIVAEPDKEQLVADQVMLMQYITDVDDSVWIGSIRFIVASVESTIGEKIDRSMIEVLHVPEVLLVWKETLAR